MLNLESIKRLAISALVVFCSFQQAQAITPTKSCVCLIYLCSTKIYDPHRFSEIDQSLGALEILQHSLVDKPVQSGLAQGLRSSDSQNINSKLSNYDLAQRIESIKYFGQYSKVVELDDQFYSRSIVIRGRKNISSYLTQMDEMILSAANEAQKNSSKMFAGSLYLAAGAAMLLNYGKLMNPTPEIIGAFSGLMLYFLEIHGLEYYIKRPFKLDHSYLAFFSDMRKKLNSNGTSYWSYYARNTKLLPESSTVDYKTDEDSIKDRVFRQNLRESLPTFQFLMAKLLGAHKQATRPMQWFALDLFLKKDEAFEPELHIILRHAPAKPNFKNSFVKVTNQPRLPWELPKIDSE